MPNTDPKKLDILVWHMAGGMFVLVLMILRLIIRRWSARPAATTGSPVLDRLASIAHRSLYVIVFLMIASGWTTGWLISGAFQPNGEPLPKTFDVLVRQAHDRSRRKIE
jgi:cytochrome b561